MKENKEYFLGLDIGSSSCGWAVTDSEYNILKAKGKKLWGVRLFEEASTAEERRIFRSNRRRLDRRKLKLMWLQEIFANEIGKIDKNFFARMKYSSLFTDDKIKMNEHLKSKYSLFDDNNQNGKYTDSEYFKDYKTIYHLRKELLTTPAKDIRLLYLALHNIIKRRGHFLIEGELNENNGSFIDELNKFVRCYNSLIEQYEFDNNDYNKLKELEENSNLLKEINKLGKKDLKNKLNSLLVVKEDKLSKLMIEPIVSGKLNLESLIKILNIEFDENDLKIDFSSEDYENKFLPIIDKLPEDWPDLIEELKKCYNSLKLSSILNGKNYICEAMVDIYNKHNLQLNGTNEDGKKVKKGFKDFIKEFYPSKYNEIFRDNLTNDKTFNYCSYINSDLVNGKKQLLQKVNEKGKTKDSVRSSRDEFYKYIKSILNLTPENIDESKGNEYEKLKQEFINLMDEQEFLPRLRRKENGLFPNQLYQNEVKKILEINSSKYTFLNDKDESGLSNKDKILQILTFRIPYFVGPIGENQKTDNHWAVKKNCNLAFKPWNLDKIIDLDKSEDEFIQRMINKCTYLPEEPVLPKNSLLFSRYCVLNELNKLTINGKYISVPLKQKVFDELFKKYAKISPKKLQDFLVSEGYFPNKDSAIIGGIDKEFKSSYKSYIVFCDILGQDFVERNEKMIDEIIKLHTIVSDKKRLIERIKIEFPNVFTDEQLKKIKALNFSGWGSLSYKFLQNYIFVNKKTQQNTDVMTELWQTNNNLQQILSSDYTLSEKLENYYNKHKDDIIYQDVENLYCSPAVKRGIWQTILVIKDVIKTMRQKPSKIFVEVTRHDDEKGEKGRKLSRYKSLKKIYESKEFKDSFKNTKDDLEQLLRELNKQDDLTMRSDRLFLYFMQEGKCAYSGKPIDIEDLISGSGKYDIDHIIPQSFGKDDSINNKVLVCSELNREKSNIYPIFKDDKFNYILNNETMSMWKKWKEHGLMSQIKYDRLVRKDELSDEERKGFIERQLVETNQSVKAVIDLLKQIMDNPRDIIYSKARLVSDFRHKYDILKCRDVNDLHHAKDAYLNIVVGNCVRARFTDNIRNFIKSNNNKEEKEKNTYNVMKIFEHSIYDFKNSNCVWNNTNILEKVKKNCLRNDCLISKMSYKKLNTNFYDQTIYKNKEHQVSFGDIIPLKGENNPLSNIERYGGYNSYSYGYYMVIEDEQEKKKQIIREKYLLPVPVLYIKKFNNDKIKILNELTKDYKLKNPKILKDSVNIQSTIKIGKGEYWIGGVTNSSYVLHNANEWFVDKETSDYIRIVKKYEDMLKRKIDIKDACKFEDKIILSKPAKDENKEVSLFRDKNVKLYDNILKQLEKEIYKDMQLQENLYKDLKENFNKFLTLSVSDQAKVLSGIINRMATGAALADISLLNGKKGLGMLKIAQKITNIDIRLIIKSPSGIYDRVEKL